MPSCSMNFALHLAITLESTDFNTTQTWVAIFKNTSHVCSANIYFLCMKQQEDGELWVFLKFQKLPLTVSLVYNTSWSAFKSLGKGLECFIDKSKARKADFGVRSIREFWKFSSQSLLWTTIVVHDNVCSHPQHTGDSYTLLYLQQCISLFITGS